MSTSGYNTNLAAEFYVLSCLHRLGAEASLTLGSKKSVDIFVARGGRTVTIDVKGVAGRYDWPADNIPSSARRDYFVVLVCYNGKIKEPEVPPSVWVVPHADIKTFVRKYKGRTNVSRASIRQDGDTYRDAWWRVLGLPTA